MMNEYSINEVIENLKNQKKELINALETIIEYNRQTAYDKYGDAEKAENWACVKKARQAIEKNKD